MRPIRLEIENFTVYRGKHSLDFSPLNFFVIKGRTGAGKTSLIDAICYALYGAVPRYGGEKAHRHLISRGQNFMRVALDFSVRGRRYRVEREYEAGKKRAQSDFRFYEEGKPKPFKEEELRRHIKDILRLDYNTFTKVILLPQNQFDRFLKPQEQRERREILNSLLGFSGLFSALKELVGEEYRGLMSRLQALQLRLEQLSHISPEEVARKEAEVRRLEEEYERLLREKSELEKTLSLCRERDGLLREKEEVQEKLGELISEEETIQGKRQTLERALEILPHLPKIEHYERLLKEEERLLREKQGRELDLKKCSDERQMVEEEFRRIREEFESLEDYNKKRLELGSLLQILQQYASLWRERDSLEEEIGTVEREMAKRSEKEKELRERFSKGLDITRQVSEAIRALEEKGVEDGMIRAEELRGKIRKLEEMKEEESRLRKEKDILQKGLDKKREELRAKLDEQNSLTEEIEEFERELEALRLSLSVEGELLQEEARLKDLHARAVELRDFRNKKKLYQSRVLELEEGLRLLEIEREKLQEKRLDVYALEIRAGLREGDTCPVCGGTVGHLVSEKSEEDLQEILHRLKELEEERERLKKELSEAHANISFLERKEEELSGLLGGLSEEEIEKRLSEVQKSLKEMQEKRKTLQKKEQELNLLRKRHGELSKQIDLLRSQEAELREKVSASLTLLKRLEEEEQSILTSLGGDVEAVLEEVQRVEKEYAELRSLREKERKFMQKLEEIQKELSEVEKGLAELNEKVRGLQSQKASVEEKLIKIEEEVVKITGEKPSELLAQRLKRKMEELEKKVREVQKEYQNTVSYLQKVRAEEARLVSDIQNMEKFISSLQKQRASLSVELYQLQERFGSLEEAIKCALSQEEIRAIQKHIEDYEKERHNLQSRLESLEKRLEALKHLPETHYVEERLRELSSELYQNRETYGSLQGEIEKLKRELLEREELEKVLTELQWQVSLYERLKNDLADNQFPEFVSQLMLRRITERASYYLFKFTAGQFTFDLLDGDLHVYDHTTDHHRIVSSLSGGETFLASLSLAFAVADILSQNAPLESLFIDEGFGSLDRETRESLSEFFDLIRQSTDRLVGIITHVEDIAEKFSQRIEVEKSGGSARLKVIY
jgi:exonuclease SbcC